MSDKPRRTAAPRRQGGRYHLVAGELVADKAMAKGRTAFAEKPAKPAKADPATPDPTTDAPAPEPAKS